MPAESDCAPAALRRRGGRRDGPAGGDRRRIGDLRPAAVPRDDGPPAPRELHGHRLRADGADPGLRAGLRRPLQPGRDAGRPLPRRDRHRGGPCAYVGGPGRRRLRRRGRRQPDVRPPGGRVVHPRPVRRRAVAGGGRRHVRAAHRHPRRRPLGADLGGAVRRRGLHRRRLLVHVLDQFRQPRRHRRPDPDRHLRRHRAVVGAHVHRRPGRRRVSSPWRWPCSSTRPARGRRAGRPPPGAETPTRSP